MSYKITKRNSPNKDGATFAKKKDRIIIHWFGSGTLKSADARFMNPASDVSANYGISEDVVYEWVAPNEVAWHSGNYPMNQRSIGIEHDATTDKPASEKTYQTSAELIAKLCKDFDIPCDRTHIIGHKEVPKATQCPGTLDINRIISMAKAIIDGEINLFNPTKRFPIAFVKKLRKDVTYYNELIEDGYLEEEDAFDTIMQKYLNEIKEGREKLKDQKEKYDDKLKKVVSDYEAKIAIIRQECVKPIETPVELETPVSVDPSGQLDEISEEVSDVDQPTKEAFKEIGRYIALGIISYVITLAINYFVDVPNTETTAIILGVLRAIDKYIHEDPNFKSKGLLPF